MPSDLSQHLRSGGFHQLSDNFQLEFLQIFHWPLSGNMREGLHIKEGRLYNGVIGLGCIFRPVAHDPQGLELRSTARSRAEDADILLGAQSGSGYVWDKCW